MNIKENKFYRKIWRDDPVQLVLFSLFIMMFGLLFSRTLLSISMILLVATAIFHPNRPFPISQFFKNKILIAISLSFFIVLLSGLYSQDIDYWAERLRVKLPFLILPFAFALIPPFTRKQFNLLLYAFVVIISFTSIGITIYYALNFYEITQSYIVAKVIPTPINHIRYSLMVAFACIAAGWLFVEKFFIKTSKEKFGLMFFALFLFIFLHILAVRSGLFALYLVLFLLLLKSLFTGKYFKKGIIGLMVLISVPIISFYTIPTFKNKVDYMLHDLQVLKKDTTREGYSDTRRFRSLQIGVDAGLSNPFFGVGYGDIENKTLAIYDERYPGLEREHKLMPHSQFIFVFTGAGIVGLLLFLYAFFYPIFTRGFYKNPLFLSFNIILFTSFFTEATLEEQIGSAFYLLFLLSGINYLSGKKNE